MEYSGVIYAGIRSPSKKKYLRADYNWKNRLNSKVGVSAFIRVSENLPSRKLKISFDYIQKGKNMGTLLNDPQFWKLLKIVQVTMGLNI